MAGHELNPNRGVKPEPHTACMRVCGQSPNLRSSAAMYTLTGCDTAGAGHRSAQHRLVSQISTIEGCLRRSRTVHRMIYHLHARQGLTLSLPVAHPASRSMTSPLHRR
jgi:hypothetical protein